MNVYMNHIPWIYTKGLYIICLSCDFGHVDLYLYAFYSYSSLTRTYSHKLDNSSGTFTIVRTFTIFEKLWLDYQQRQTFVQLQIMFRIETFVSVYVYKMFVLKHNKLLSQVKCSAFYLNHINEKTSITYSIHNILADL